MAGNSQADLNKRLREAEARLAEYEETLRAIRSGEVDAVVVSGSVGDQVYTLAGADEPYRVLVQNMPEGAVTLTHDGLILFSNEQFASMTGMPLERVIGARFQEFLAPGAADGAGALLAPRDRWRGEMRIKVQGAADAASIPVYVSASAVVLDGMECIAAIIADITEQKRKEELLAVAKLAQRLDLLVDNSPLAVIEWDGEFRIIRWAGAAEAVFGWTAAEARGKRIDELPMVHPDDVGCVDQVSADMVSGARSSNVNKNRNLRKDGAVIHCEWYNSSIRDESGKLTGILSQVLDVTERDRAEEALRESSERLQCLYDSKLVGILVADDENILEANDGFLQMLGYTREDLDKRRIRRKSLTPAEYRSADERAFAEVQSVGSCAPYEKEYIRKDGARVPVLAGATQLRTSPVTWLFFVLDLTERKELERRLLETQKLESIGLLAGGIAHDFNNLLVGILGNASLAQDMVTRNSNIGRLLGEIIYAGERAAHLTKQMLAYSGKGQFVIEPVSLSAQVVETVRLLQPSIPSRVSLHFELDGSLPFVMADPGQMQQVIMNLMLNAVEAIGDEAGAVFVRTGVRTVTRAAIRHELKDAPIEPGSYVCVEVRDSGCGMAEDTKNRIFDPFFTTKFTGRGLGLSAVSGIIRGHKGAITVTTALGKGSVFAVLLPAMSSDAVVPAAREPVRQPALCGTGTILVIDDEDVVLKTAKAALEHSGYTVRLAASASEGIELLSKEKEACAELVILDLSMPGMSGQEALPELRKICPDVKVIISSGYDEKETMRLFAGQNITGFLQKPYSAASLASKVKAALE